MVYNARIKHGSRFVDNDTVAKIYLLKDGTHINININTIYF